jgi:hypothetical protein
MTNLKRTLLTMGTLFSVANAGGCLLIQDNIMNVRWDAFKTDSRITVHGKFTDVKYTPNALEGKNFKELLVGSTVEINSNKIDTAITSRDDTVVDFFFKKLSVGNITGTITNIKADNHTKGKVRTGIVTVDITLNGKTKSVNMNYNYFKEDFSATGSINLADFSALDALASIDKSCHDLYKGKIWSDVTIKFNNKIKATLCNTNTKK